MVTSMIQPQVTSSVGSRVETCVAEKQSTQDRCAECVCLCSFKPLIFVRCSLLPHNLVYSDWSSVIVSHQSWSQNHDYQEQTLRSSRKKRFVRKTKRKAIDPIWWMMMSSRQREPAGQRPWVNNYLGYCKKSREAREAGAWWVEWKVVENEATEPGRTRSWKCWETTGRNLDLHDKMPWNCLGWGGGDPCADKRPWEVGTRVAADRTPSRWMGSSPEETLELGSGWWSWWWGKMDGFRMFLGELEGLYWGSKGTGQDFGVSFQAIWNLRVPVIIPQRTILVIKQNHVFTAPVA